MNNIKTEKKEKKALFNFLNWLERTGNKLPQPLVIFAFLAVSVIFISALASGSSAIHPLTKEKITVVSLMNKEGFQRIIVNIIKNFVNYPPLGVTLISMLGVSLADKSGLFSTLLRKTLSKAKGSRVIMVVVLISIMSNALGDTGFVLMPPLAAMIFSAAGMNPLVGIFTAYAGVAGGFSANFIICATDMLVVGFTQAATAIIDKDFVVNPVCNWYFTSASTLLLTFVTTWVTVKIVAPRFNNNNYKVEKVEEVSHTESKGLKAAAIAALVYIIFILILAVPQNGLLRDPATGSLTSLKAPLMGGIAIVITSLFFITGLVYGKVTGTIKSSKDVVRMLGETMSDMGPFIAVVAVSAQFFYFFMWSNLGVVLAIKGAALLQNLGLTGMTVLVPFIILVAIINIFMGSLSAKWGILGTIFVPMFMLMNIHPALTQIAYRIGDSITNCITPLSAYLIITLAIMKRYDKDAGIGTFIANMLPYSLVYFVAWVILLLLWYILKLPLGPGTPIIM